MNEPSQPVSENPWEPIFHHAVAFYGSGRLDEAGSLFAAIVEHNPGHIHSLQRLAAIRRHQGRLEESLGLVERIVAAHPDSAEARNSLGNTLNAMGRQEEALEHYRAALALRADFPEAHLNTGNSLKALGRYEEAADAYRAAIALRPAYAEAHGSLGNVLARLNRPAEAVTSFGAALSLDPKIKLGFSNLGLALADLNRHEEALPYFQRAREMEPDAPEPLFNEALVQLALGNFEEGFPGYEARWRIPELKLNPHQFRQPQWDGRSEIAGKTVLLHAEQGLGDTILFARFVEPVVERGARVILNVQQPLTGLMRSIPGVEVTTGGEPIPDFDLHAPFGSLPLALKITLKTLPARTPYLHAPSESATLADLEKAGDQRPLVGVCWAGNPNYASDHNRSIPLSIFERVLQVPGVRFVSLQQNLRAGDEAILARHGNVDLISDRKGSGLADTAALISKLDLVITVDTVIGHLTGAINKPVWVLLAFRSYWAWLRGRTDSPWYPTARLFRQPEIGDWKTVMERAAGALQKAVKAK